MYTALILWIIKFTLQQAPSSVLFTQQRDEVSVKALMELKSDAFEILKTKCNSCHRTRNPAKVFTVDNMNGFATEIYKQVFVKKRMPKGSEVQLTSDEYERLRKWLSQNITK